MNQKLIGSEIIYLEEVSSTNTYAHNLTLSVYKEGTLVVARRQTCGRGQNGRSWLSPEGGLYFSFILRPELPAGELTLMTMLTALAVAEAIEKQILLDCFLKWPNDVLIQGKKVAGILLESKLTGEQIEYLIVGAGINVNNLMENCQDLAYPAVSLRELSGARIDINQFLFLVIDSINYYYQELRKQGKRLINEKWQQKLIPDQGNHDFSKTD